MVKVWNADDHSVVYDQGEHFTLTNGKNFESTNTPISNGIRYYEATCYSGKGYALFGYKTSTYDRINFYPRSGFTSPCINIKGKFITIEGTEQQQITLPFSITELPYTIGVAIDISNTIFTVFYKNNFFSYKFNKGSNDRIFVDIWGAVSNDANEDVSFNFGRFPFHYNVTSLIPWQSRVQQTCKRGFNPFSFVKIHTFFFTLLSL